MLSIFAKAYQSAQGALLVHIPRVFFAVKEGEGGKGGKGGIKRKLIRGAPPEMQPLTLLHTILGRKDTPFVHLTLENNERPF